MINKKFVPLVILAGMAFSQGLSAETIQDMLKKRQAEQSSRVNGQQNLRNPQVGVENYDLYVRDNGLPPAIDNSPLSYTDGNFTTGSDANSSEDKPANKPKKKEARRTIIVTHDGLPTPIEMTVGELEFLNARKEHLSQYLYENYQLKDIRNILREYNKDKAFDKYMDDQIPISPGNITKYRREKEKESRAMNARLAPVNHHLRTINVRIENERPIQMFVVRGMASSLVFFDSTGAPWPIEGVSIGDSSAFSASVNNADKNVLEFTIIRDFAESNALVTLKGMSVPFVITMVSNGKDNDDRLSARLPQLGPNAEVSMFIEKEFENKNDYMIDLMNGKTLEGAKQYRLSGVQGQVYLLGDKMLVKTFENLVRPGWSSQARSSTGYNIYEVRPTTELLFAVGGKLITAKVENLTFHDIKYAKSPFSKK